MDGASARCQHIATSPRLAEARIPLGTIPQASSVLSDRGQGDVVVGCIPLQELFDAMLKRHLGLVAEQLGGVRDVGEGDGHISRRDWRERLVGVSAQAALEERDEPRDLLGPRVAEIEHLERGAEAHGGDDAGDDVRDEGEVALQLRAIVFAVLDDRQACEDGLGEGEVGHVGPAVRAVDGEEAQARQLEPVEVMVDVRDVLVGLLRRAVQARLTVDLVDLLEWNLFVDAIHRRRRGVGDGDRVIDCVYGLKERDEALHVGLHVREWLLERVTHARLRGEVDDVRDAPLTQ
mmetsp:Transcript_51118/g.109225  ORF Transcript_51118/g.109225 Transcript_51118/m.109225 type:complete len:291 (+) Transcript_51118:268-1140(+)|eukprot:CAMPEP_0183378700 /NCGR_PEP_ID=MMETSP0164_2-20130417/125052_1 /TAXON_ID=221442 /ORGANISM="Coccolithus pelagicus ssp braarudi, Strain PLY182g" /LENGTH=290 /DNA_ID=CAMNT_0025556271 /DNA_START=594 /DNA_END=1469 /DNA_ORIENTATION=-